MGSDGFVGFNGSRWLRLVCSVLVYSQLVVEQPLQEPVQRGRDGGGSSRSFLPRHCLPRSPKHTHRRQHDCAAVAAGIPVANEPTGETNQSINQNLYSPLQGPDSEVLPTQAKRKEQS